MVLSGRQLRGFTQYSLDMFVALFGKWSPYYLVGGALFVTAKPAITDGLFDRGEARNLPHLQGPGQGGDRPHSGNRPESFDSVGQQGVPLQRTHQGVFRFLQPYDGIPAELQQRSNIGMDLLVARQ